MENARRLISYLISGLVLAVSIASAPASEAKGARVLGEGEYYDLHSALTDRDYRIYLDVPSSAPPAAGYPVIYVLDGNWLYNIAASAAVLQFATGEIPKGIVVGIGYPTEDANEVISARTRDLSLPATADQMPPRLKQMTTGGADRFYNALTQEIRPFVEAHAAIDRSCQTLFGHSLGGLFALHILFTHPDAFRSFVVASPAIWWGGNAVLKDEAAFESETRKGSINTRMLMTIGGLETRPATSPLPAGAIDPKMLENMLALSQRLEPFRSPYFEFQSVVLADETHNSSLPAAISKALRFGLCPSKN